MFYGVSKISRLIICRIFWKQYEKASPKHVGLTDCYRKTHECHWIALWLSLWENFWMDSFYFFPIRNSAIGFHHIQAKNWPGKRLCWQEFQLFALFPLLFGDFWPTKMIPSINVWNLHSQNLAIYMRILSGRYNCSCYHLPL